MRNVMIDLAVAAVICGSAAAATKITVPSNQDLTQLYAGKTWYWKAGAGYFAPDGTFKCILRSTDQMDECTGKWSAQSGALTIVMNWKSTPPRSFETAWRSTKVIFYHETQGTDIWQKKEPNGAWFVFKHATPEKGDEWWKLQSGDKTAEVLSWKL